MSDAVKKTDPLEESWVSETGLPCHIFPCRFTERYHLCGYVQVPFSHPLYGVAYNEDVPSALQAAKNALMSQPIGKRGVMNLVCMSGLGARAGDLFDVHGSITFTGPFRGQDPDEWWYGFDCGHSGDDPEIQDHAYVRAECESLARQMVALGGAA